MKRTQSRFKRFYIDDMADMQEYNELINDPLVNITLRELLDEKTTTHDNDGNSRTEIRPTYLIHWEEQVL